MNTKAKLDRLNDLKCRLDVLALEKREIIENLLPSELKQVLDEIENEFDNKRKNLEDEIAQLETEIKAEVLERGETVKGTYIIAVWNKGRITWDSKQLDDMIAIIPGLEKARIQHKPTVSFRSVK